MKEKKVLKSESITTELVPQNPYMAANNRSNVHCDAYMSDSYTCAGPLGDGFSESLYIERYAVGHEKEICISVTIDTMRRLITVGNWFDEDTQQVRHELLLLDPETLEILASKELLPGGTGSSSTGSGGYIYLDQEDRPVVPLSDGKIGLYQVKDSNGALSFEKVKQYDPGLPKNSSIISVLPDWKGRLWVVSEEGYVAVVDTSSGNSGFIQLEGEGIANSFAVDCTGGVFIASDHAMYRFDYDESATGKISQTWRCGYDRGTRIKPGQFSQGTGTTPTLQNIGGASYVAITDNADPQMHVLVYRREKSYEGDRLVGKVPVFQYNQSDTENSLIGVGSYFIVENNYGYTATPGVPPTENTTPGIAKIGVNQTVFLKWEKDTLSIPSLITKASIQDGMIYTYSLSVIKQAAEWYFTVLNFYTGEVVFKQLTGIGADYDNYYSGLALHPDTGDAYVPVCGGMVRISNKPQ